MKLTVPFGEPFGEREPFGEIGEPLYLKIELDWDSIFDIFAQNLVTQSGIDEE